MTFGLLNNEYSVYKFDIKQTIDTNIFSNDFISITKTEDEISVVAISGSFRNYCEVEANWRILKIIITLDFNLVGVISKISTILTNVGISIFVLSTYNTDYIMVKKEKISEAIGILKEFGYEFKNEN